MRGDGRRKIIRVERLRGGSQELFGAVVLDPQKSVWCGFYLHMDGDCGWTSGLTPTDCNLSSKDDP